MHKRVAPARWFAIHVIAIKRSVPALRSRCFSPDKIEEEARVDSAAAQGEREARLERK